MPKTKFQEFIFTMMTPGVMIFCMGVYNASLSLGALQAAAFRQAARSFPMEWLIGCLFAFFAAGRLSKRLASCLVRPGDRPILIILAIQSFTVCIMVPLMSAVGAAEHGGITASFPFTWLQTAALNFPAAFFLQLFIAGPLCRRLFRALFSPGRSGAPASGWREQDRP